MAKSYPYEQQFIVDGKWLGTAPRSLEQSGWPPRSYAMFCPVCAELWARCPISLRGSQKLQQFCVLTKHCRKCATDSVFRISGEMWVSWDEAFNDALPIEVLRRELLLYLDELYSERNFQNV